MAFELKTLLEFNDIVIQCHDNPDADALASGYALWWYLKKHNKNARFIYSGKFEVSKSNLCLMIMMLHIPVSFVETIDAPELLVTVDCQYGESNVTKFPAKNVAVIDHHQVSGLLPEMSEVRSAYGACSTVLYELIRNEGLDVNEEEELATAMYYGLMTDTNGFTEIHHPADKDLRDEAKFRNAYITRFRNSNISKDELSIAGDALHSAVYNETFSYAIVEADPCDPNILGIISDMLLEVDTVSTCLVYSILPFGIKISVRSCVSDVRASELAGYLCEGIGGGGGHLIKAGGFIKKDLLEKLPVSFEKETIRAFLNQRMKTYYETSEIMYAGKEPEDVSHLKKYDKLPVSCGYVKTIDLADEGTKITVRTLEGDVDVSVSENTYIAIGVTGEIYPINKAKFETGYKVEAKDYVFPGEYTPHAVSVLTGERIELLPHAHACIASGGTGIYARELDHRVKVFTTWDPEKYYLGLPGDYLAVREDDLSDFYIIAKDIFNITYKQRN